MYGVCLVCSHVWKKIEPKRAVGGGVSRTLGAVLTWGKGSHYIVRSKLAAQSPRLEQQQDSPSLSYTLTHSLTRITKPDPAGFQNSPRKEITGKGSRSVGHWTVATIPGSIAAGRFTWCKARSWDYRRSYMVFFLSWVWWYRSSSSSAYMYGAYILQPVTT